MTNISTNLKKKLEKGDPDYAVMGMLFDYIFERILKMQFTGIFFGPKKFYMYLRVVKLNK